MAIHQETERSADLLERESAILRIKAIELRYGLKTRLVNKQERHLLDLLAQRPDLMRQLTSSELVGD